MRHPFEDKKKRTLETLELAKIGVLVYSVVLSILKNSCQMRIDFCLNISSNRE